MRMSGMIRSWLAQKCDHKKPRHVEGRQKCYAHDSQKRRDVVTGRGQNLVLTPKPRKRRACDQGERSSQKSPKSHRHLLLKPAHVPDVLFVVQTMNYGARS